VELPSNTPGGKTAATQFGDVEVVSVGTAKEVLKALVDSLGIYQSTSDKSRVFTVFMSPMMVAEGMLLAHECPPVQVVGPAGARERLIDVLNVLYGERAALGCKIL
jgi:hypothetical protein